MFKSLSINAVEYGLSVFLMFAVAILTIGRRTFRQSIVPGNFDQGGRFTPDRFSATAESRPKPLEAQESPTIFGGLRARSHRLAAAHLGSSPP